MRTKKTTGLQFAATLLATLVLAACGGGDSSSSAGSTPPGGDTNTQQPPTTDTDTHPTSYTLTVDLAGLNTGAELVLKDQQPGSPLDDLYLTEDGSYTFTGELKPNDTFDLVIARLAQPTATLDTDEGVGHAPKPRSQCQLTGAEGNAEGTSQNINVKVECETDLVYLHEALIEDGAGNKDSFWQVWSLNGIEKTLIHQFAEHELPKYWIVANDKLLFVTEVLEDGGKIRLQMIDGQGAHVVKEIASPYDYEFYEHDGKVYLFYQEKYAGNSSLYRVSHEGLVNLAIDTERFEDEGVLVGDAGVFIWDSREGLWKLDEESNAFIKVLNLFNTNFVDPINDSDGVGRFIDEVYMAGDRLYISAKRALELGTTYTLWTLAAGSNEPEIIQDKMPSEGFSIGSDFLFFDIRESVLEKINEDGHRELLLDSSVHFWSIAWDWRGGVVWGDKKYFFNGKLEEGKPYQVLWAYGEDGIASEVEFAENHGNYFDLVKSDYYIDSIHRLHDTVLIKTTDSDPNNNPYYYLLNTNAAGGIVQRQLTTDVSYKAFEAESVAYMNDQLYFLGAAKVDDSSNNIYDVGLWKADPDTGVLEAVHTERFQ
ncbi:hypothetical protein [Marinospirillum minutulum]|uniref:hypothetical protein n=1 Tax=Marinospirillum minutulum TaxID=64974 RepID=UPI00041C8C1D|nr:hypothetical protein [Marinospirillum minutulum]